MLGLPALLGRTARTATLLVGRHRDAERHRRGRAPEGAQGPVVGGHHPPPLGGLRPRVARRGQGGEERLRHQGQRRGAVAGEPCALRRYLAERKVLPRSPLVALVPMSVRTEDERGHFNNRVSPMFTHLRTDVADPAKMVKAIARATKGAKEDHNAVGAKLLMDWSEHAAPSTFTLAARVYSRLNLADRHRPIYNLVVSNVPGPTFPLYLYGAELVAAYPMAPCRRGPGSTSPCSPTATTSTSASWPAGSSWPTSTRWPDTSRTRWATCSRPPACPARAPSPIRRSSRPTGWRPPTRTPPPATGRPSLRATGRRRPQARAGGQGVEGDEGEQGAALDQAGQAAAEGGRTRPSPSPDDPSDSRSTRWRTGVERVLILAHGVQHRRPVRAHGRRGPRPHGAGRPRARRRTFAELDAQANRFAHHLAATGVGVGDHVGIYGLNSVELGRGDARRVQASGPCRSTSTTATSRTSCAYLFDNADLVRAGRRPGVRRRVADVRPKLSRLRDVVHFDSTLGDDADRRRRGRGAGRDRVGPLGRGAGRRLARPRLGAQRSGDDRYMLYTGGTTGMPKGVVWRQEDVFMALGGGIDATTNEPVATEFDLAEKAGATETPLRSLCLPPLMHGAAQWSVLRFLFDGSTERPRAPLRPPPGVAGAGRAGRQQPDDHRRRHGPARWWRRSTSLDRRGRSTCRRSSSWPRRPPCSRRRSRTGSWSACPNILVIDAIGSTEGGSNGMTVASARRTAMRGGPTVDAGPRHRGARRRPAPDGARHRRHRPARPEGQHPARLLQGRGQDRRHLRHRRPTACATWSPATWPCSRPTARSPCWAGGRAASTPAARRCSPRRSRACSRATRRCSTCWSWACPTSAGASGSPPWSSPGSAGGVTLEELDRHCRGQPGRLQGPAPAHAGRRGRALPRRQARLPVGPAGRPGRRRGHRRHRRGGAGAPAGRRRGAHRVRTR